MEGETTIASRSGELMAEGNGKKEENGKKKGRWDAGVTPYAEMGYWVPDYEPKDTDILAAFRITPSPASIPWRRRRPWPASRRPPRGAWCGPTG